MNLLRDVASRTTSPPSVAGPSVRLMPIIVSPECLVSQASHESGPWFLDARSTGGCRETLELPGFPGISGRRPSRNWHQSSSCGRAVGVGLGRGGADVGEGGLDGGPAALGEALTGRAVQVEVGEALLGAAAVGPEVA